MLDTVNETGFHLGQDVMDSHSNIRKTVRKSIHDSPAKNRMVKMVIFGYSMLDAGPKTDFCCNTQLEVWD